MASKFRLTTDKYRELLASERALHDLLPEMDAAQDCGIDCQAYREIHAQAMEKIAKLKTYYAPTLPVHQ